MTVTANIHEAKTTLSKLIERAMAGEEVIIAKAGKPLIRLEPIGDAAPVAKVDHAAWMGTLKGRITMPDNFEFTDEEIGELFYDEPPASAASHVAEPDDETR